MSKIQPASKSPDFEMRPNYPNIRLYYFVSINAATGFTSQEQMRARRRVWAWVFRGRGWVREWRRSAGRISAEVSRCWARWSSAQELGRPQAESGQYQGRHQDLSTGGGEVQRENCCWKEREWVEWLSVLPTCR